MKRLKFPPNCSLYRRILSIVDHLKLLRPIYQILMIIMQDSGYRAYLSRKSMNMNKKIFTLAFCLLSLIQVKAQTESPAPKNKRFQIESGIEGSLLQFAQVSSFNIKAKTVPRFSYYFNTGLDFNYKVSESFSPFTGIHLRNIGLILKPNDSMRFKHRVYTLGVPVGIKAYALKRKLMLKAGADIGLAINYKWKTFINDTKTKNHEFFSDRVARFFPSVFFGARFQSISITGNYYLNNFFNTANLAYANTDARIFTLGIGLNFDSDKFKVNMKKKSKPMSDM